MGRQTTFVTGCDFRVFASTAPLQALVTEDRGRHGDQRQHNAEHLQGSI